jgi:site-specific recombinase XerC
MSTSSAASDAAVEAIVAEFRLWLARERGLSAAAMCCYGKQARKFLSWLPDPVDSAVRQLDSTQVTSFMVSYCQDRNISSAKATVTAVRALLRYLHATGQIRVSLAGAVPAVAGWRLASLPRGLDAAAVTALLDSCDRDTIVGRRDHAILMLLARLGLRGAEVADLRLGDVDWRSGEITVRGKGNRLDRLPLPSDVGESMVVYLTAGRPLVRRGRCSAPPASRIAACRRPRSAASWARPVVAPGWSG